MIELKGLNSQKAAAINLCHVIMTHGKEAWWVGGCVRDLLMGREPNDIDIATNATTDQIMRWFPKVIPTGIKHGTVTVIKGEHQLEVTTYRGESGYSDGRRPDMTYSVHSIEEDLARRDFTMNALAWDPVSDRFCDPFGGAADIMIKLVRAVGVPNQRFTEDGLRCLRACRFAATLEFSIDEATKRAISGSIDTYKKVSVERIVSEWRKAFKARMPSIAFDHMADAGLLGTTVPEFIPSYKMTQNRYHAYDIFRHTLHVIDSAPKNEIVQLACLFHDISKPACLGTHPVTGQRTFYNHEEEGAELTKTIMTRLKFPTHEIEKVSTLVRHHLLPHESLSSAGLRRWVRKVGAENVDELLDLAQADLEGKGPAEVQIPGDFVSGFREQVRALGDVAPVASKTSHLAVNGSDVMEICKIKPGPAVGKRLDALLEYVTDWPEHNTREFLLELLADWG